MQHWLLAPISDSPALSQDHEKALQFSFFPAMESLLESNTPHALAPQSSTLRPGTDRVGLAGAGLLTHSCSAGPWPRLTLMPSSHLPISSRSGIFSPFCSSPPLTCAQPGRPQD